MWYCQNHKRNPWFAELVDVLLTRPVYSHMARAERICPAMGLTPIPACDILDIGDIHDVNSFEQYFACTHAMVICKGLRPDSRAVCEKEDRFSTGINFTAAREKRNPTGPL